jgi:hypothetical protein
MDCSYRFDTVCGEETVCQFVHNGLRHIGGDDGGELDEPLAFECTGSTARVASSSIELFNPISSRTGVFDEINEFVLECIFRDQSHHSRLCLMHGRTCLAPSKNTSGKGPEPPLLFKASRVGVCPNISFHAQEIFPIAKKTEVADIRLIVLEE